MLSLPAIRLDGFTLVPVGTAAVPMIRLSGNGDADAFAPLDRSLKQLHEQLLQRKATSVVVDLTDLYFLNSSCLKAFVSWIYKVRTAGKMYHIRLQLNPRQHWQKRGLEPLQRLAPAIVFLDEVTESRAEDGAERAPGSASGRERT